MNYNDMTMAELREMCAKHGIVAGRSKAETIKRIEARDAELQDFANRHGEALAKAGMAIRSGGKDYKPEDHRPCQGCETIKAEAALAEYRAAHPEIAAEGAKMCDCELSHNGLGMVGRECDCPAGAPEADYSGIEARALAHDIEAAKRDTPPTTPAYGVLSRRMVTMIRNQPKASIPGSVRRRMQREAARQ